MRRINIISCGPGGRGYITYEALERIKESDLIIGSERLLKTFAPRDKRVINIKGKIDIIPSLLKTTQSSKIAVLVTGDAGIYSLARKIVGAIGREDVEIIPGVSSLQVAFARIKESWEDVKTFTFHGRDCRNLEDVLTSKKAVIFCDKKNSAKALLKKLFNKDVNKRYIVCQNLTLEDEEIIEIKKDEDIDKLKEVSTELLIILEQ